MSGWGRKKPAVHQDWVYQRGKRGNRRSAASAKRKREHAGKQSRAALGTAAAAARRKVKAQKEKDKQDALTRWRRVYRGTTSGRALVRSLDRLVYQGALTGQQAAVVLDEFDECHHEALNRWAGGSGGGGGGGTAELAGAHGLGASDGVTLRGTLTNYQLLDRTYRFDARDVLLVPSAGGGVGGRGQRPVRLDRLSLVISEAPGVAAQREAERKRRKQEGSWPSGVRF